MKKKIYIKYENLLSFLLNCGKFLEIFHWKFLILFEGEIFEFVRINFIKFYFLFLAKKIILKIIKFKKILARKL